MKPVKNAPAEANQMIKDYDEINSVEAPSNWVSGAERHPKVSTLSRRGTAEAFRFVYVFLAVVLDGRGGLLVVTTYVFYLAEKKKNTN